MNIKDYAKQEEPKKMDEKKFEENFQKTQKEYGNLADEFVKKYGQMNENEMLSELFKLINQKKADGTFDAQKIKEASIHIAPLLDENQREYMNNLLKYLD